MSRNSTRNTPSTDVSKVAEWIAARGLSQAKAARLLEMRRATLRNYLKGTVVPSQSKLAGIIAKMEELDTCNQDIVERKEDSDSGVMIVDELRSEISKLKRRLLEGRGLVKIIREIAEDEYSNHSRLILPPAPQALGKGTLMVPVVHVSDTQLGKVTNDYDSTVGAKRIRLLAKKVVELIQIQRQHHKIDEIQLYLGGDMVEGETGNYPSQPFDVDCSVIRQAMKHAPDIFEAFVMYLLEHVKKVNIKCVRGNHGRGASRHAVRHTETNWDTVFYWVLHDRLIGSDLNPRKAMRNRVTFEIPEGDQFWVIDRVLGWGNLMVHGDQIRGWAGIPWYGVCVPLDHEILTKNGWKTYDQLTIDEMVMVFDPLTHENRWEKLEAVNVHEYEGELLTLTRPGDHCIRFTPDHKWPVVKQDGYKGIVAAKDFNTSHKIPLLGEFHGTDTILSSRHAALLGWLVTDGSFRWRGNHCEAVIYQSVDNDFLPEIELLVGRKGRVTSRKPDGSPYMMTVPILLDDVKTITKLFKTKSDLLKIVGHLSREAAEAMFDAMMKAEARKRDRQFRQLPGPVADAFQILAVMVGRTAWATLDKEGMLGITPKKDKTLNPLWRDSMTKSNFTGKVWCPTTPTGTWWVRHKGMVMPTGNSKKANGWSDAMPKDWDNLFFGHFHTYASGTLNYRRWFCNGTTESSNSYALEELGAAGLPSQRVVFMTEKYGISSDHQVYLTEDGDREQHLPLMKRRMTRALAELGEGDLRKLLDVVSKGPPKAGK